MKNLQMVVSQEVLDAMVAKADQERHAREQLKRMPQMIEDGVDTKMLQHRGSKLNRHERRALAKLQRKDEKLNRRIQQLESTLKRKPQ